MVCSNCGHDNRVGQKFCAECGATLTLACLDCGNPLEANDKFCGECGASVHAAPDVQQVPTSGDGSPEELPTERRFVSVLFADLVGYTPFTEHRDSEEVRDFLTRYFDGASDIVGRFGGVVDKFIGDAVMAVWGAQIVNEDDAERAVRAGLELVDMVAKQAADLGVPDLSLRVGVLTGEAAVGPGGNQHGLIVGDMVNTASRLQTAAAPSSVLVGESTFRAAQRAIDFESVGELSVKGKAEPVRAWRALRVVALRGGEGRADALEAPFVGRDRELRLLKELLHATETEKRTRLVSVLGNAGVGKSRLIWELEKYIDGIVEDVYWHAGRSPAYGEGVTFWALGEMVRSRCGMTEGEDPTTTSTKLDETLVEYVEDPEERDWLRPRLSGLLGVGGATTSERGELFAAWRTFFGRIARRGATILVFEELHWADSGLLDFIEELPDWSKTDPILVITLARPELLERRPGWGSGRADHVSMHLGPLTDDAMNQLVAGLVPGLPTDAVAAVKERAAGVPLYAVELVRMLVNDGHLVEKDGRYELTRAITALAVPDSLHAVIGARLDRLDPSVRSLVQDASVLGQTFRVEAIASVRDEDPEALLPKLSELVRRELLEVKRDPRAPDRGQYSFVQALIREVAYGRISRPDRYQRHLRAAEYFEGLDDGELAAVVASHYLSARDAALGHPHSEELSERATSALRRAVERATSLHSHEQALDLSQQALAVLDDAGERIWFVEQVALSAHGVGREDLAEESARLALSFYQENRDLSGIGRAGQALGLILNEVGKHDEAIDVLEGLLASHDLPASPELAASSAELARAYMIVGNSEQALRTAEGAAQAAELLDLVPVIVQALITRASVLADFNRYREGVAVLRGALDLADEFELTTASLRARNNLGFLLDYDDPRRAATLLAEGYSEALRAGERFWAEYFALALADSLFGAGQLEEAKAVVEEHEQSMDENNAEFLRAIGIQIAAIQTGQTSAIDSLTELLPRSLITTDPAAQYLGAVTTGWLLLISGQPKLAFDHVTESLARHSGVGMTRALYFPTHAAAWSGDLTRVERAQELARNRSWPGRVFATHVRHLAATHSLLTGGDNGQALTVVADELEGLGLGLEAAMTWAELGFLAEKDSALSVEADHKAREAFAAMGANGLLAIYETALARDPLGTLT